MPFSHAETFTTATVTSLPDEIVIVCRTRFFEQLGQVPELRALIPFVHQWYATPSKLRWQDTHGRVHAIDQGDGGEQGDALMPGLFCLALRPALTEIQERLPQGAL
eukprot:11418173-Karenia_brevis.AAC.1